MAKLSIQQAIEQAKANPNSEFATQLRKSIESGQLDQAAQQQGVDLSKYGRPKVQPQGNAMTDIGSDIQMAGQEIKQSFQKAGQKVQEAKIASDAGEQSQARGVLQGLGATAGFVADTIGTAFKTAVKAPLSQNTENKIKSKLGDVAETIRESQGGKDLASLTQDFQNWYDNELTPAQQRDLDAFGGVAKLATEFVGAGTAKRTATEGIDLASDVTKQIVTKAKTLTPPKIEKPSIDGLKLASDVIKDVTPKAVDVADRQVAKALNLAPVEDIARFKSQTGNDIGEFMARNDLIQDTKEETVQTLAEFQKNNLNAKRDIVSLIDDKFTFEDLPEFEGVLNNLEKQLKDSTAPEFKNQLKIVNDIKSKGEFDLSQVDYVRSLSDDINSFYTRTGDVRDGLKVANEEALVKATRRFIEDIVANKYPDVNINEINNNIRSSRFLIDTIAKRAGKEDTKSLASLGDYAVLGIGSNIAPGVGLVSLLGKKLVESSPIRLRIARKLYGKDGRINKTGKVTQKELKEINELIRSELDEIIKDSSQSGQVPI